MKIYTINTTLVAIDKDGNEEIIDSHANHFAYKTHENACKAVEDLMKVHEQEGGYKRTTSPFKLVKARSSELMNSYELYFGIAEHYISEFEKES